MWKCSEENGDDDDDDGGGGGNEDDSPMCTKEQMATETNRMIAAVVTTVVALFKSFVCRAYETRTPHQTRRRMREWVRIALRSSEMRKQQPQTIVLLLIICPFPWAIHDTCCCFCCYCYGWWCRERYCELTSLQLQRKRSVHIYTLCSLLYIVTVTMYYFAFYNSRNWYLLYVAKKEAELTLYTQDWLAAWWINKFCRTDSGWNSITVCVCTISLVFFGWHLN